MIAQYDINTAFRTVTDESFEFTPDLHVDQGLDPSFENWSRFIPMRPDDTYDLLTEGLPGGVQIEISIDERGQATIRTNLSEDGQTLIADERTLSLGKEKSINPGDLFVSEQFKGHRYGRKSLRNQIEFGHACGARTLRMKAAGTTGSYLWAEAGFLCDQAKRPNIAEDLRGRLEQLDRFCNIPPKTYGALMEAIYGGQDDMLQRIVAFDNDIKASITRDYDFDLMAAYDKEGMTPKTIEDFCARKDGSVPLGRALLYNFEWPAYADLNDPAQVQRLDAYFGFNHLHVEDDAPQTIVSATLDR